MGFIREFAEYLIRRGMEEPEERDRKLRDHILSVKEQSEKVKESWKHPLKPYGYWKADKNNAKYLTDLKISRYPGRQDPYDTLSL